MEQIELIVARDSKSPIAEAYRAIRTNIQFAGAGKNIRCIGFTSASPEEGKSTTISNIALAMAQDGKHILIIDADMRKPTQHRIFNLAPHGLSNCIAMNMTFAEAVQASEYPNLDILAAGPVPPNPSELLGSEKMRDILAEAKDAYDFVLVDMPPVLAVTDAVVLASRIDGIIMVVRAGSTPLDDAKGAKNILKQGGANLMGAVLNAVPQHQRSGSHYYYYYYYYGKSENEKSKGEEL